MNHCQRILNHLQEHGHITAALAYESFGCARLAARIYDLRERGHRIDAIMAKGRNRYGETTKYAIYVPSHRPK